MTIAKSAAESRIFVKFAEDGSFAGAYIEHANINIIPPLPIFEDVQGDEIMETIPAHYEDDPEKGTMLVPEQIVGTGTYEVISKIVGYTEEVFEPALPEGYEEITYSEYQMLCGNDPEGTFIRDPKTKQYVLKPPYVPTVDEKLAALDVEYEALFEELNTNILLAAAKGDEELKAELLEEEAALKAEYEQKRSEIQ